jgi:hypothetical protein
MKPGVMVHAFSLSTKKAEAERSFKLGIQDHPGQHSENLSWEK